MPDDTRTAEEITAQAAAEQAPPVNSPSYLENSVASVRKDQEQEQQNVKMAEANALARLSGTEEWEVLKAKIQGFVVSMRRAEAVRMGEGKMDLQSIGLRSVIINEIADFAQRVITMVEQRKRRQIVDDQSRGEDVPETNTLETYENADSGGA